MRLVEQGLLDLDEPLLSFVPELSLSDPDATKRVTLRHVLTHTNGVDGDVFAGTGRGDDCLARFVAGLDAVPQNHPLAATWSYCNTGYSITGRLIEKVTGMVWDEAMHELLFRPLGLTRTVTLPEQAAMQAREAELPDPYTLADSWGLGWCRQHWDSTRVFGHDGNTVGQSAFLRVLPDHDLSVALLTNGGHTRDLYESVVREVVRELAGVEMAEPLAPPQPPPAADVTPHVGRYERTGVRIDVWRGEQGARLRLAVAAPVAGVPREPKELDLVPVRHGLYAVRLPGVRTWTPVTFYRLPDGTPYVHMSARATRKVA